MENLESTTIQKDHMYEVIKGVACDGKEKSMYLENGKLYVYHGQNPRGIFLMAKDAIKRFNSI